MKEAEKLTGLTRWTIEKYEANDPDFPKRIGSTFSRVRRFRRAELVRWLDGNELTS